MVGRLTEFAAQQQRRFEELTSPMERKQRGHFGTPSAIAEFMAETFSQIPADFVRVLDPGAGVGTLSAAVCQRLLKSAARQSVYFELWENDSKLLPLLETTMMHCQQVMLEAGRQMQFRIKTDDFVLANAAQTLFDLGPTPSFDLAILNPPYFKLRKDSPQARAMEHVVHGQPNIYALFMAVAVDLLAPGGELVAITPRSYFNGPYFKRFRKWFFDRARARQIHIFESRAAAFKDDAVLQENVILRAQKGGTARDVVLTTSQGRDLDDVRRASMPYHKVLDSSDGDHVVRVASSQVEGDIVAAVDALPCRFRELGFEISTGPVVTFRSTEFLRHERSENTAPLLWMHNVRPFITQFPPPNGKPTHIEIEKLSRKLLLPAKTYLLLKRFTAKEEKRRLVAGIMTAEDSYSEWVGLENHLNYVYRKNGELCLLEAYGLAAFFNSALVDRYFRAISGSTQVNATEIRGLPMPDADTLHRIGLETSQLETRNFSAIAEVVGHALRLPRRIMDALIEVAS